MISIIVPVYNVQRYLISSLDSLINQDGEADYEIVLVDDGSTDASGDICLNYAQENDRIRVVRKPNGGLSSARNAGIESSRGEYLMFVDGDDSLDPVTISALTKAISSHPNCDILQFRYEEVSPSMPLGHCVSDELADYYECTSEHDFFLQLHQLGGVAASSCTKLFKRSVIGDMRFKEGILHEDEEFVTRLLPKCSCIGYCSNEFYKYLMRPGSIIHSEFSKRRLDIIHILKDRITYFEKKGYSDLVEKFKSKLYGILRILWDDAYSSKDTDSLILIEGELDQLDSIKTQKIFDFLVLKSEVLRSHILRGVYHIKRNLKPLLQKARNARIKYDRYKECKKRRKQLNSTDFTIISNNCWGGLVYQYFGLPYNTPIAGCGFMDEDYLKFLEKFDYYISLQLVFVPYESSKRYNYYKLKNIDRPSCPIAMLDDIEVCFTHYASEEEAREKWERRCKRINKDKMLVKMSQRYTSSAEILERFEKLPYSNKICFTESEYMGEEFVYIPELKILNRYGGDETPFVMEKVDLVSLINNMK